MCMRRSSVDFSTCIRGALCRLNLLTTVLTLAGWQYVISGRRMTFSPCNLRPVLHNARRFRCIWSHSVICSAMDVAVSTLRVKCTFPSTHPLFYAHTAALRQSLLRFGIAQCTFTSYGSSYQLLSYCRIDRLQRPSFTENSLKSSPVTHAAPAIERFLTWTLTYLERETDKISFDKLLPEKKFPQTEFFSVRLKFYL